VNGDELKQRVVQAPNLAALVPAEHDWDVFAQLRSVKELQTRDKKPFLVLELADLHAVVEAKVWENSREAMEAAKQAPLRGPVKVRGKVKEWQGQAQLVVERLKAVDPGENPDGYDPDQLVDPALAPVEDLCCKTLVFRHSTAANCRRPSARR
jgi:DNA polymerase III alpha subunit